MSHVFTITVSDADYDALAHIALDPEAWFTNMIEARAMSAKLDIQKVYVAYKTEKAEPITALGLDAQVVAAFDEGIVKTAAQAEADARAMHPHLS
jgi:hypothetical protein